MRRIILFTTILLVNLMSFAQTNDEQIISRINTAASKMTSMQCDFVQTKNVKLLNDKMVSHGKMYYQQSNKLRWEYTTPYTYTFILNDSKVLFQKNKKNDVIDVNQNKMFKEIVNIMMNSVVGKCLSDKKSFKTTIKETTTEWVVTLVPQAKQMKQMFTKIILHFNMQQAVVVKVEMYEKNGDTTVIALSDIKKNQKINEKLFSVN